jgi:hypothetical protein
MAQFHAQAFLKLLHLHTDIGLADIEHRLCGSKATTTDNSHE